MLASFGGAIGTAVGVGAVSLVAMVTPLPATIGASTILITVGLSGSIGLFFGVVPARRAARARAQILSLAQSLLRQHPDLGRLAEAVAEGRDDPYTAAERLVVPTDS